MESDPINPAVYKFLLNAAMGTLALTSLYSIYHQKYDMSATLSPSFQKLRAGATQEEMDETLHAILGVLQTDAVKKEASSRFSAEAHGKKLVSLLKLEKDGSNANIVRVVLKIILRVYGADAEGHTKLQKLDGYKALLAAFSEAHRQGNDDLMEELAQAMQKLTEMNEADVVVPSDIPKGAEGAYALANIPATVKMLRILDPDSPVVFLHALVGTFANLCILHSGAVNIGRGTDGHSGISHFLRLLDHSNRSVVEKALQAIRFMTYSGVGLEEIAISENVERLADKFDQHSDPSLINATLSIIIQMANSKEHSAAFFTNVGNSSIPKSLFEMWVRHPDKTIRARAEVLCRLLSRIPVTADIAKPLFEQYSQRIQERRAKDEEEIQRANQMRQQQEFQQMMMMQQMGMDPSMFQG